MFRQRGQEPLRFFTRQKANAARLLLKHAYLRRTLKPFPIVYAFAQDRAQQLQRSVYRGVTQPLREFYIGDLVDEGAADGVQRPATKELIEPPQLGHILARGCLVRLLLEPTYDCLVPGMPWFLAELRDPPQLRLHPIVKLLR